jgi:hypothetical protein
MRNVKDMKSFVLIFLIASLAGGCADSLNGRLNGAGVGPTVTNVSSTAASSTGTINIYKEQSIPIQITFSSAVAVTGTPLLSLNSGGTASYSLGSNSATLTFAYSAGSHDAAQTLDVSGPNALTLNGGTIKDVFANNANLTLPVAPSIGSLAINKTIQVAAAVGGQWRWLAGNNTINQQGSYGVQGAPSASNYPGARNGANSAVDASGNVWIFGGGGIDSVGTSGSLSDLWKYDGTNWTWVAGSNLANQNGVYGTQGTAASGNFPGARSNAAFWIDSHKVAWVYGGLGYASSGGASYLNDLWKFDGVNWTWVSGNNTTGGGATWGTINVPASSNTPGSRYAMAYWLGPSNKLYLFSGTINGGGNNANDVWMFDQSNSFWTWVGGANSINPSATWGTQGIAAPGNIPAGRRYPGFCSDSLGDLWVFGGSNGSGKLNDLWKFDGTEWTWVSGSQAANAAGVYGTQGVPGGSNVPGGRSLSSCAVDSNFNFWLTAGVTFNDLWKFDGTDWTWMAGSSSAVGAATYGVLGVPSSSNMYGGKSGAVAWIDSANRFWVMGGSGLDSAGSSGNLSDIFRYDP